VCAADEGHAESGGHARVCGLVGVLLVHVLMGARCVSDREWRSRLSADRCDEAELRREGGERGVD